MIIPLLWFLKSKQEPILKRLRLNSISYDTLIQTIMLSLGVIILSDELDRIIQSFFPAPEYPDFESIIILSDLIKLDFIRGISGNSIDVG